MSDRKVCMDFKKVVSTVVGEKIEDIKKKILFYVIVGGNDCEIKCGNIFRKLLICVIRGVSLEF